MTPQNPGKEINLQNVKFQYNNDQTEWILKDINFSISKGEIFVLVGPSGCGKSTILKLIAGFHFPQEGKIKDFEGRDIEAPSNDRVVVFQSLEKPLFEWLNVLQNVEFGLKLDGVPKEKRRKKARKYLKLVDLDMHEEKYPLELSGGMKQRVQIARTLVLEPEIILMDEPFASLDAQTRHIMQEEVINIWQETDTTILYITHDIKEAVLLGGGIGVMTCGPNATIKKIINNSLSYPRDRLSQEFTNCQEEVIRLIEEEVSKSFAE